MRAGAEAERAQEWGPHLHCSRGYAGKGCERWQPELGELRARVGGQNFASKPDGRIERERCDSPVSARGQPLLSCNFQEWVKTRGHLQLAKFRPSGIYLKDLQTAPNYRLWTLRLIRELCSDLQNFVPSASI